MRRLLLSAAMLIMFCAVSVAADLTFQWDANTGVAWEKVRLYERSGPVAMYTYALKGEVAGTITTMTITGVTPGAHTYIVRSFATNWESADSNSASTGAVPTGPGNFKIVAVMIGEDGTVTFKLLNPSEVFQS